MNFLMFPSLEIMELKLRADIWSLNCILMIISIKETLSQNVVFKRTSNLCMLLLELIYVGCSFDILSEPFCFFLTANLSTASTKKYNFHIQFQIFLGFPGDVEMSPKIACFQTVKD